MLTERAHQLPFTQRVFFASRIVRNGNDNDNNRRRARNDGAVTRRHYARFTGAMNSLKFVPYVVPLLKRVN